MGKFFNDRSARCTSCYSFLRFLSLARNDRHLYPIGQLYGCKCGATKVWTNSIRNEKALLAHYATGSRYFQGFCNDLFNGEGREIMPWRSVAFPGEYQRGQIYGTHKGYDKFESGQGPDSTLCVWSGEFSLEVEGAKDLVASYEPYVDQIKDLMAPKDSDVRKNPTLLDIPGVEAVVDTAKVRSSDDAYIFGNAASYEDGVGVVAWHVTDDPTGILKKIERKTDFKKAYGNKRSELGPGLYVSAVPHLWKVRARNKWLFLGTLTDDENTAILALLHKDLARSVKRGYLSDAEHKYALRLLADAERENDLEYARALAGQPYNIKWSDPEWLAEASESAATKATPPQAVKVALRGRFAQLARSYPDPDVLRALRRAGFAGAFTRGGMGSNAELVVFHGSSLTPIAVETV